MSQDRDDRADAHQRSTGRPPDSGAQRTRPPERDALELCLSLPIESDLRRLAEGFLLRLSALLPGSSLGLCLVIPEQGQWVLRFPDEGPSSASRLFDAQPHEWIEAISTAPEAGSTLHVAGPSELGYQDRELVRQCARVLGVHLGYAAALRAGGADGPDLDRLRAQAIQKEKLASLGQIAAGVVHELNNPLTSILAYSDYLAARADALGANEVDRERIRRIGEAASRILKFSRDLVAYARPSAEVPGPVELKEVVEKALLFCSHEFEQHQVRVSSRLPEFLLVRGISGHLTQVFVNLFTNAAHAMRNQGGQLSVTTELRPEASGVAVLVRDEGIGIDAADVPHLFDPFFTTKAEAGRGSGLGLSIVKSIVEVHGGEISVSSRRGQGTTFEVLIPLVPHPASTPPRH